MGILLTSLLVSFLGKTGHYKSYRFFGNYYSEMFITRALE